jgi:PAS domain S-box-containing protein
MKEENDLVTLYWRYWPFLAIVLIVFYIVWILFTPESFGAGFFSATLVFSLRAAATYAAIKSIPGIFGAEQRRGWRYFSIGLWIWMISDALYIIAWGLSGEPWISPSFADLLHLAGYLAMITGCASYPLVQPGRFGRIRESLEVSILTFSVLSISWLIYLSPSISSRTFLVNTLLWLSISPIFDLTLTVLGLRLLLLREQHHERLALGLFSLSFIVMFVSDMISSYGQALERTNVANLTQAGWMMSVTLLGLAFQRMTLLESDGKAKTQIKQTSRWIWRLEPLVPVAFTYAVVGFVFFDWWFSEILDWVALSGAGILIVLLFARQGVISGQREMSQFAALVNSTSDMAFILDERGLLQMANPVLYKALGVEEEPSNNLDLRNYFVIEKPLDFDRLLSEAHDSGWSGEVMLVRAEGEKSPVLLSLNPVGPSHDRENLLAGTAHDLTSIRLREDELRTALHEVDQARSALEKLNIELEDKVTERTRELADTVEDLERLNRELKELDQLKSEFVALVSHELRAPMTNIRSGLELLLERYPDLQETPKQSLRLVHDEVQRLSHFVETILDLSALEAGRFPIELGPVHVEKVLNLALQRFPEKSQARIKTTIPDGLNLVQADVAALESVFFHLLDNAFKYAPKGQIIIEIEDVGLEIEFRVRDSGPGIPHDQHARIFEMFHRLDTRDAREIYGYGLGLPMVHRLLTAMDGRIEVSEEGGGTEMIFWLPQANAKKA